MSINDKTPPVTDNGSTPSPRTQSRSVTDGGRAVPSESGGTPPLEENPVRQDKKTKKRKKGRGWIIALVSVLCILALLVAGLACTYFIMRSVGKNSFVPSVMDPEKLTDMVAVETFDDGKTIGWRGKRYLYNENIVSVAFMGIDEYYLDSEDRSESDAGQNDTNMVMAFDTETGQVSIIVIPRDTMVEMDIYDGNGNWAGIQKKQLCLAYAYGDGAETSCENAVTAMERLLYGIEISSYASLDLRGIGSLNNAVGGVEIQCLEDIGEFKKGETYHLWDDAARDYVQRRDTTKFNSDAMRRERQLQYAKAFAKKAVDACLSDFSTVTKLYNAALEYTCTDVSLSQFTYLAGTVLENKNVSFDNIYVLEGEAVMGDRFMEVYPDAENVLETVLRVFYTEEAAD